MTKKEIKVWAAKYDEQKQLEQDRLKTAEGRKSLALEIYDGSKHYYALKQAAHEAEFNLKQVMREYSWRESECRIAREREGSSWELLEAEDGAEEAEKYARERWATLDSEKAPLSEK